MSDPAIKPGFKTTEFWTTIIKIAASLLALFGLINIEHVDAISAHLLNAVLGLVVVLANMKTVSDYIKSRETVKVANTQALTARSNADTAVANGNGSVNGCCVCRCPCHKKNGA